MVFDSSKVIDWDVGVAVMGSQQAAEDMLAALVEELPLYRQEFEDAWQAKNYALLQRLAHKLHGGTCYCPTPKLKFAAILLEQHLLEQKSKEIISDAYQSVCTEMQVVIDAVATSAV